MNKQLEIGDEVVCASNDGEANESLDMRGWVSEVNSTGGGFLVRVYKDPETDPNTEANTEAFLGDEIKLSEDQEAPEGWARIDMSSDTDGENIFVSMRIPAQEYDLIVRSADEKGQTLEEWYVEMLHEFLDNHSDSDSDSDSELESKLDS